jgi:hypothetical protein
MQYIYNIVFLSQTKFQCDWNHLKHLPFTEFVFFTFFFRTKYFLTAGVFFFLTSAGLTKTNCKNRSIKTHTDTETHKCFFFALDPKKLLFVGWFGVVSSLSLSTPLTTEEERKKKKNKKLKKKNFLSMSVCTRTRCHQLNFRA